MEFCANITEYGLGIPKLLLKRFFRH